MTVAPAPASPPLPRTGGG